MLDTLRRMFAETRPIDNIMLIIELLVLLLIAYEVLVGIQERRKERNRKTAISKSVALLRDAMLEGQKIQHSWPKIGGSRAEIEDAVKTWDERTRLLLRSCSAQAETAFIHEVNRKCIYSSGIIRHEANKLIWITS